MYPSMKIICPKCNKKFSEKWRFDKHLELTTPCDTIYPCPNCKKIFKSPHHLERHLTKKKTPCNQSKTIVVDIVEKQCHYCYNKFSTKGSLVRHLKTCENEPINNSMVISKIRRECDTKIAELTKQINAINVQPKIAELAKLVNSIKVEPNTAYVYIKDDPEFEKHLTLNKFKVSQWVYFIISGANNKIKIGLTRCLLKRVRELQTGNPQQLEIIGYIETDDMYKLERIFHKYLADSRISGEWFDLSVGDVYSILEDYREMGVESIM